MTILYEILLLILAYLLGSIPNALIVSKVFFKKDIREFGSKNMGATNTLRVLGNPHHFEYWTDLDRTTRTYVPIPVPRRYLAEMIMDRRAACIVYQGENYRDDSALNYFDKSKEKALMHPETRRQLSFVLTMLAERGEEETFRYLKEEVLAGLPWPWEKEISEN